jgi:hypothetical protein
MVGTRGRSNTATWRTSSIADCGCQPGATVGTHHTPQAWPGPDWTRKVRAATLLHVGQRRRTLLLCTAPSQPTPGDVDEGKQVDPLRPRWGPQSLDLGHQVLVVTSAPPRRHHTTRAEPPPLLPAAQQPGRGGRIATVHCRLPASTTWEGPAPGREEAPAAGTAQALPGGWRRWGIERGGVSGRLGFVAPKIARRGGGGGGRRPRTRNR